MTACKPSNKESTMNLLRKTAVFAALSIAFAVPGAALAQQKLKFAHVYETSEPYHKWAVWAAAEIEKQTSKRYSMDVFPASALGNETQINQALSLGTVDMIYTGQAFAARTYPPIAIGGAPYMFRDFNHWKKFSESPVLADLMDGYHKKGNNRPIAAFYYGVRHTTANKAINKPEDMKGLKLRVPDAPLYVMYPKSVGAQATPIAFAEVYLALQNKTVDAQENPLPTILAKKFYEVQTHVNLTGHITEMLLAIVGGHVWGKLSDADKKVFVDTFRIAAERSNGEIAKSEEALATEFSTVYKKTVVKSDRAAFQKVFVPFHTGPDATWDKALYDKVQAIK
jgi:tripartite ATP-independent transporter DctP family solute receptor